MTIFSTVFDRLGIYYTKQSSMNRDHTLKTQLSYRRYNLEVDIIGG